ncbi:MAG: L,D-transpeptidase family protein [Alphaproteobacteria bacterium]|nr:L,D-transpeptidase family protein [Alphaproteobacteria bacterium]
MPLSARVAPLPPAAGAVVRLDPFGEALRAQLAGADPALEAFYRARDYRPIWIQGWGVKRGAQTVVQAVADARADDLDPESYDASGLPEVLARAASGRSADLAAAEIALSAAASGYLSDLHAPKPGAQMIYVDPSVAPPRLDRISVLRILGASRSPSAAVADLERMNPYYQQLRASLAALRANGGDPATARLLKVNLERARALPADFGPRYILVDATAQRLWLYQDGQPVDSMRVVVGKPSEPTPAMAGLVRYAVIRPYWNIPPDLVQNSVAPKVLRYGPGWLASQHMQALSGWTPDARVLSPQEVDWAAVAAGRVTLRMRQLPGPDNMMGKVKFVFPNSLGIYLHDSPLRQFFADQQRTDSAGCVRLSAAPRLAKWLLAADADQLGQPGPPETRIDLSQPIPVYIVYFTAIPQGRKLSIRPDIYHRDSTLEAELDRPANRA